MGFYGIDIYYIILVIPAFIFSLYAQFKVKSTYGKYSKCNNRKGLTGYDIARSVLDASGLYDVQVEAVPGELTDHYDPRTRVVRLSEGVFYSTSIAAVGVAAHEVGHAVQHKIGYAPLAFRSGLVPVANIGSMAGPYMAIIGIIFNWGLLAYLGILLFTLAVAFYMITLPVEFNASARAIKALEGSGMLVHEEIRPARKVLNAAAMTYVASAAVAMAQLLRLILLVTGRRNED